MIRSLLKLAFLAIICIVVYNRFFGTDTEKEQSKRIFKGVGNVFIEVRDLVRQEKDKFDGGKYDAALTKMQGVLERLKNHATDTKDAQLKSQIADLEKRKAQLEKEVDAAPSPDNNFQKASDKLKKYNDMARQMETLTNDIQRLVNQVAPTSEQ
jgi:DNA repair exonuclease SbcCD ATPase subunit